MAVWKEFGRITVKDLANMQERVNDMNPPAGMRRIPHKIQSGFFSITADEWMRLDNSVFATCTV